MLCIVTEIRFLYLKCDRLQDSDCSYSGEASSSWMEEGQEKEIGAWCQYFCYKTGQVQRVHSEQEQPGLKELTKNTNYY